MFCLSKRETLWWENVSGCRQTKSFIGACDWDSPLDSFFFPFYPYPPPPLTLEEYSRINIWLGIHGGYACHRPIERVHASNEGRPIIICCRYITFGQKRREERRGRHRHYEYVANQLNESMSLSGGWGGGGCEVRCEAHVHVNHICAVTLVTLVIQSGDI